MSGVNEHRSNESGPEFSLAGFVAPLRIRLAAERRTVFLLAIDFSILLALLIAYLTARVRTPVWPRPFHFPSGLMTVSMLMFAIAAGFVMEVACRSRRQGNTAMAQRMIALGVVGWGTFLFLLAMEWGRLYFFEQVTLLTNPQHVLALGLSYYGLSGYQAAHVMLGCVWMILAANGMSGTQPRWRLESLSLFVHYTNALFVIVAFFVILSSTDLGGF